MRVVTILAVCGAFALAACVPHTGQVAGPGWPSINQPAAIHVHPFFVCTRQHESDRGDANGNGLHDAGYQAVSPGGAYRGAYQFAHSTWQGVVSRMQGGIWAAWALVAADQAPVDVQDRAALQLANERGAQPWGGRCAQHIR